MKTDDKLLTQFQVPTPDEWQAAAEHLLKGKPFDKVMKSHTPEGIELDPIYWREVLDSLPATQTLPGFDGFLRGTKASGYGQNLWEIAQELPYGTPLEFNRAAREDLMRGQTALNIILDIATLKGLDPDSAQAGEVGACGLSLACLADVETAFKHIIPEAVGVHFRTGCAGLGIAAMYFAWAEQHGSDLSSLKGSFGMDPIAVQAAAGALPISLDHLLDEQAVLARYCSEKAPGMKSIGISTMPYHQAGASAVEELGAALATGVYYLQAMIDRGLSADDAARQMRFSFAIGPNFFMEIAKFRAARTLWAKVVETFGGDPESQKITVHARTGLYNKTRKDPYVNMLRTTTESLSAVIAGIDSLCVGNFDEVTRLPESFGRRISRNTQVILQEECELTEVADPAGGSWAVEWLTNEVAEKSWAALQQIEFEGGIFQALKTGSIQATIGKTAHHKEQLLNQRRSSLIGTNVYPNIGEKKLEANVPDYAQIRETRAREIAAARIELDQDADTKVMAALGEIMNAESVEIIPAMVEAVKAGATIGETTRTLRGSSDPGEATKPLQAKRLAAPYEALRDASARFAATTGQRPLIFLVNLGPLRRHKLRADFTKSFFETGGFEVISPSGFENPSDAVSALNESGAAIAVVCGTDEDYAENFGTYAQAIKFELPGTRLVLAGFPGENEDRFREAGMDDYIFIKSDNYAINLSYLEGLGVL